MIIFGIEYDFIVFVDCFNDNFLCYCNFDCLFVLYKVCKLLLWNGWMLVKEVVIVCDVVKLGILKEVLMVYEVLVVWGFEIFMFEIGLSDEVKC